MHKKFQLVYAAALTLVAVDDLRIRVRAYNAAKRYLASAEAFEETEQAHLAQIRYLCELMDKHNVPYDEFDLIALQSYNN